MFKLIAFSINLFALIMFNFLLDDVSVTQNAPTRVETVNTFEVQVTIHKGKVEGYAKYQANFPEGIKVTSTNVAGSKFSFGEGKAKFVWMNLPAESDLNITYTIEVTDPSLTEITVGGTFSYLDENQRVTVDAIDQTVFMGAEIVQEAPVVIPSIQASRTITDLNNGVFEVRIELVYQNISGFAKVQEVIPPGGTVRPITNDGAVFSTIGDRVKFVWMNFPEDKNSLVVVYELVYPSAESPNINDITGEFAFVHEGESKKEPILNGTPLVQLSEKEVKDTSGEKELEIAQTEPKDLIQVDEVEPVKTPQPKKNTNTITQVPNPETGVVYKVQLMAAHKVVPTDVYFKKNYNYTNAVEIDLHEGWHKYISGSFNTYKEAKLSRNNINNTYKFKGPFVVAYNSGQRISVQEALIISNQKWYN